MIAPENARIFARFSKCFILGYIFSFFIIYIEKRLTSIKSKKLSFFFSFHKMPEQTNKQEQNFSPLRAEEPRCEFFCSWNRTLRCGVCVLSYSTFRYKTVWCGGVRLRRQNCNARCTCTYTKPLEFLKALWPPHGFVFMRSDWCGSVDICVLESYGTLSNEFCCWEHNVAVRLCWRQNHTGALR